MVDSLKNNFLAFTIMGLNGGHGHANKSVLDLLTAPEGALVYDGEAVGGGGMPRSYLAGLTLSNNGTDANNDIDIAVGACRDGGNTADLVLAATLTKRLDAAWAVGSGNGGLDTGSKASNTLYHVWLIARSDTGVVDALFSTSATAPTMPASYDLKRRIGSVRTVGTSIRAFRQTGDHFTYFRPIEITATGDTSAQLHDLSVPTGLKIQVLLQMRTTGSITTMAVTDPDSEDWGAAAATLVTDSGDPATGGGRFYAWTNTSGQIRSKTTSGGESLDIAVLGWVDRRGRDD